MDPLHSVQQLFCCTTVILRRRYFVVFKQLLWYPKICNRPICINRKCYRNAEVTLLCLRTKKSIVQWFASFDPSEGALWPQFTTMGRWFSSIPGSTPVCGIFFSQDECVQIITHVHPGKKKTPHTGVDPGKLNERTHCGFWAIDITYYVVSIGLPLATPRTIRFVLRYRLH